jgi:hypothetical protein
MALTSTFGCRTRGHYRLDVLQHLKLLVLWRHMLHLVPLLLYLMDP